MNCECKVRETEAEVDIQSVPSLPGHFSSGQNFVFTFLFPLLAYINSYIRCIYLPPSEAV